MSERGGIDRTLPTNEAEPRTVIQPVDAIGHAASDADHPPDHARTSDRVASMGKLAAKIAHQIGNPLAALVANLDLALQGVRRIGERLGETGPISELVNELEDARQASDRIRVIVNDLKLLAASSDPSEGLVSLVSAHDSELGESAAPFIACEEHRPRVLVVDDEPAIGRLVQRALGEEHEVTCASRVDEALALIDGGERFDVILCDMVMPELSGQDLFVALRRTAPGQAARMIFMTGGAFAPATGALVTELPNPRLEKPFDLPRLRTLIKERLR